MNKLMPAVVTAALLGGAGCVDFQQSREAFCGAVAPRSRADICQDGPQCVVLDPARNTTGVALSQKPAVTFDMNVSCPADGLRMVQNTVGEPVVAGTTVCAAGKATFTPSATLLTGRVYKVYVQETIVNDLGTPALCPSWTFTTTPTP